MKSFIFSIAFTLLSVGLFAQETPEATYFSFASDDHHDGPTFSSPDSKYIYGHGSYDLIVDVNEDLGGGQVTFQTEFKLTGLPYDYQLIPCGGAWLHIWKVKGDFSFYHYSQPGNPQLLEVRFEEAVLTSLSPNPDSISETMTLQGNQPSDPNLKFTAFPLLDCVIQTSLGKSRDFAFTFTNLRGLSDPVIDLNDGRWLDEWVSEGSFSASAQ